MENEMPNIMLCGQCNRAAQPGKFLCSTCEREDDQAVRDAVKPSERCTTVHVSNGGDSQNRESAGNKKAGRG